MDAYEVLLAARDKNRPKVTDFFDHLFTDFLELRGDRNSGEDPAILGGIAFFEDRPVTVIGHRKGKGLDENIRCNFGMPGPQGYRKAARLMRDAERFGRPVITFIDTPGAYPGKQAEENGQSAAIAENLALMSGLKVPIICVVTGEGCSGDALAIGVGDRLIMLEKAVYSVLSPEGMASILWKDSSKVEEACGCMKMTAEDLYAQGIADEIIKEKKFSDPDDFDYDTLRRSIARNLRKLEKNDIDVLLKNRYEKYRTVGRCIYV